MPMECQDSPQYSWSRLILDGTSHGDVESAEEEDFDWYNVLASAELSGALSMNCKLAKIKKSMAATSILRYLNRNLSMICRWKDCANDADLHYDI